MFTLVYLMLTRVASSQGCIFIKYVVRNVGWITVLVLKWQKEPETPSESRQPMEENSCSWGRRAVKFYFKCENPARGSIIFVSTCVFPFYMSEMGGGGGCRYSEGRRWSTSWSTFSHACASALAWAPLTFSRNKEQGSTLITLQGNGKDTPWT